MRLMVMSDLHLEFGAMSPSKPDVDAVVLAGDVHTGAMGVEWAADAFDVPVIYVPGNHERYGGRIGLAVEEMKAAAAATHVFVLERDELVLDGVRFLGATLWSDFRVSGNQPLAELDAQRHIKDYRLIQDDDGRPLTTGHVLEEHRKARFFLESRLDSGWGGKTVVVTHHAPCELSISERFRRDSKGSHVNGSYASRLEGLMGKDKVAVWVHGHTHDSFDYDMFGTRVVCNPRGYAGEQLNGEFKAALVVEV